SGPGRETRGQRWHPMVFQEGSTLCSKSHPALWLKLRPRANPHEARSWFLWRRNQSECEAFPRGDALSSCVLVVRWDRVQAIRSRQVGREPGIKRYFSRRPIRSLEDEGLDAIDVRGADKPNSGGLGCW